MLEFELVRLWCFSLSRFVFDALVYSGLFVMPAFCEFARLWCFKFHFCICDALQYNIKFCDAQEFQKSFFMLHSSFPLPFSSSTKFCDALEFNLKLFVMLHFRSLPKVPDPVHKSAQVLVYLVTVWEAFRSSYIGQTFIDEFEYQNIFCVTCVLVQLN